MTDISQIDLSSLSMEQLVDLNERVQTRLNEAVAAEQAELTRRMKALENINNRLAQPPKKNGSRGSSARPASSGSRGASTTKPKETVKDAAPSETAPSQTDVSTDEAPVTPAVTEAAAS